MLMLIGLLTFFILATLHGYVCKLLVHYPYFFAR